jgi:transcriptional regulator with XRE-family HTH domain
MCGFCVATGRLRSEHELPEPEDFQKDLKAWRKQKGMTQIQLADHLMVKQPLVVEVEKGRKAMPGRWVKILQNIT